MSHWADAFLGRPWVGGQSGPEAYDCHGVVRAVYRDRLGITLPIVSADAHSAPSIARAMHAYDYADWDEIAAPERDLDVVMMTLSRRPHHVGVYLTIDGGGVLTAVEGAGVIYQPMSSLARHGWRITNVYRRRA